METDRNQIYSVGDFVALLNQTLEYAYPSVEIEGEVASFKVNQGKYVFFDLKDSLASVGCFMTVWQLRTPIEDGMKVVVRAVPKLTTWGKFSLTVQQVRLSGEGSLKKSFELLRVKLEAEGLFDSARKRALPAMPGHIGVVSSTQAAGYTDFITILNDRWGGMRVDVAHVQVQGEAAPDQMIRAIRYFNTQQTPPEVLVLLRGGGSADDLAAYNDELLVREIAASRVPTLVGVGHEVDTTLADLVADVRAATPSNAAQLLVPDRRELAQAARHSVARIIDRTEMAIDSVSDQVTLRLAWAVQRIDYCFERYIQQLSQQRHMLAAYDPHAVLSRGYSIVRGDLRLGATVTIETIDQLINAEVTNVSKK
jgi:exodeoxyribonuclease VII large subunit